MDAICATVEWAGKPIGTSLLIFRPQSRRNFVYEMFRDDFFKIWIIHKSAAYAHYSAAPRLTARLACTPSAIMGLSEVIF